MPQWPFNNETAGPTTFCVRNIPLCESHPANLIGTRHYGFHLKIKISSVKNELMEAIIPGPGTCPLNFASTGSMSPVSGGNAAQTGSIYPHSRRGSQPVPSLSWHFSNFSMMLPGRRLQRVRKLLSSRASREGGSSSLTKTNQFKQ
jgi:hypothetical protein